MATERLKLSRIYKDLDLAFSQSAVSSDVSKKYDVNAVKQSLRNILLTNYYERPFKPDFGTPIGGLLFEPADELTLIAVEKSVEQAVVRYEPRVKVDLVSATFENEQTLKIQIFFHVIGIEEPQDLTQLIKKLR
jgi:phage baseplate assembly protein W